MVEVVMQQTVAVPPSRLWGSVKQQQQRRKQPPESLLVQAEVVFREFLKRRRVLFCCLFCVKEVVKVKVKAEAGRPLLG